MYVGTKSNGYAVDNIERQVRCLERVVRAVGTLMFRKESILIGIASLIIILSAGALLYLTFNTGGEVREEILSVYRGQLQLLADRVQVLVRRSESAEVARLLRDFTSDGTFISYAAVQTGGRPFAHTFAEQYPAAFTALHALPESEPVVNEITLNGRSYTDFAMLIGVGSAIVHFGVPAERINSFGLLPRLLPQYLLGLGLFLVAAFAGYLILHTLRQQRPVRPQPPPVRVSSTDAAQNHWATIVESTNAAFFIIDPDSGRIQFVNARACGMVGLHRGMIVGSNIEYYFASSERGDLSLNDISEEEESFRGVLINHRQEAIPVARYSDPLHFQGREQILITCFDISELKDAFDRWRKAYAQSETLANHDKLTRLFNRRAIQKHAEAELNRAERGSVLSFVLLDIDHFKKVNDTHGHNVGDEVLKRVAIIVRNGLRPYDWIGRWGGEEFLVILPGTPLDGAAMVAERLRAAVEEASIHLKGYRELKVTISLGVTATGQHSGNSHLLDSLIQQADQALYFAKDQGRNRIGLYNEGEVSIYQP